MAGYDEQMRHFVEAYRAGVEPRETFEDGLVVNSVIDAAYRSMASGRWEAVEVPTCPGGRPMTEPVTSVPALEWLHEATALLARSRRPRPSDRGGQPVVRRDHRGGRSGPLFGTGHSRIPVEEMFPRYGSYPGFNPMVELSMTFHTQVVGSNGQRQAMFIERMPGLAEVILDNFTFGPHDMMIVFSASGLSAVPVEMARGARRPGLRVIAVTSVAQSMSDGPDPGVGSRLMDEADLVIDLCTPPGDAMDHDRRPGHTGRSRFHDHRHRHRQLHQGPDGSAARRARRHAAGHHPGIGRRGRALAEAVRGGLREHARRIARHAGEG